MNDSVSLSSSSRALAAAGEPGPARVALACMVVLAVVLGIGRFAFTPLLPLMLHGGSLDIRHGGWLASFNYAGYFVGAVSCAALRVEPARMVRAGLVATALLTAAMALTEPFWVWAAVRFAAGAVSAWTFVFASQWGLRKLAEQGAPEWGGVIYTGPGVGIVGTGLFVSAAGRLGAAAGWLGFGVAAALLSALVWRVFGARRLSGRGALQAGRDEAATARPSDGTASGTASGTADREADREAAQARADAAARAHAAGGPGPGARADARWLVALYGIPGFGYIITATFLPVIARHALPGSAWPDLFWPMFGVALVAGALGAARLPAHWDNRLLLAACYLVQAVGIAAGIVSPTVGGFALGSVLIGLPFTAITLFAMREARRLHGNRAAGLMGYATAAYGIGQIVGPLVAAPMAAHTGSFSPALWLAACALLGGALGLVVRARGRVPSNARGR